MKRMFTLLALVWAGSSMGADWKVTQSESISAYVMCHQGDCPVRTAKVLDLPVAVPMPARVSDSARAIGEHPFRILERQFGAAVRLYEGALSRAGEEHGTTRHAVCAGEPVSGKTCVTGDGINPPAMRRIAQQMSHSRCRQVMIRAQTTGVPRELFTCRIAGW